MKKQFDFIVVGAGFFGSVFARQMTDSGKKCLVIEKRHHIAGNAYSEEMEGIQVHMYGPHIFHTADMQIWKYVNNFAKFNHFRYEPIANFKGELYSLPFNMNTFHQMWGVNTPQEVTKILDKQRNEFHGSAANLEEQAISLIGRDIYEKLIKGYTEKQWGRECRDLPSFIITRLPVRLRYDNNYFNDPYQGIPAGGYTKLVERILDGIPVELGKDYLKDKEYYNSMADRVVYTGPIDTFFDCCYGHLDYRSLRFETKVLDIRNYQGVAGMNFTDFETPYTRIVEHKHFEFGDQPGTVVTWEYPQEWSFGQEPYYPINDHKNQALLVKYQALAGKNNRVIFGGRLGEYRYFDMDLVIRKAMDLAKKMSL